MSPRRLSIPEAALDLLTEPEKVDLIVVSLSQASIDACDLIYCGIDGTPLRQKRGIPDRTSTFGLTLEEFKREADYNERHGKFGSYPLLYALDAAHSIPAIITYSQEKLKPSLEEPEVWLPRNGTSVSEAAKAIIFFTGATVRS
jgi:hypothetical protein